MPNNPRPKVCAIIAAAGKSSRMNPAQETTYGQSKQFIEISGKTVIEKTVAVFNSCRYIDEIIIAAKPEDTEKMREIIENADLRKIKNITAGGETRIESVFKAVREAGEDIDFIAIHDGARCFISGEDIERVILKAIETGAAAAGTKVTDTIKRVKYANGGNYITETVDRDFLWAVQTPQVFRKDMYLQAMDIVICKSADDANNKNNNIVTDDCAIMENAGYPVSIVECSKYNIKITDTQDLVFLNLFESMGYGG